MLSGGSKSNACVNDWYKRAMKQQVAMRGVQMILNLSYREML